MMVGDQNQLPPTVTSKPAARGGLERSLFARLVEPGGEAAVGSGEEGSRGGSEEAEKESEETCALSALSTALTPALLSRQYRMHPGIAEFPSWRFYQGRVKSVRGVVWCAVAVIISEVPKL